MIGYVNRHLSVSVRLFLVVSLFIIATAVSAVLLARYGHTNIAFSQKEVLGTAYNKQIWTALHTGKKDIVGHQAYDNTFNSAAAYTAFVHASSTEDRTTTAAALMVAVADGSNLTLDPDLDSFYVMDAVTVKLPTLLIQSQELESSIAIPASAPDRRIHIAMALDHFASAAAGALTSLDSGIKNNPSGQTHNALQKHRTTIQHLTTAILAEAQKELDGKPSNYKMVAEPLSEAIDTTWKMSNDELTRLINARLTSLKIGLRINLGIVISLILLAMGLTHLIASGLKRRFSALDAAMHCLNQGDHNVKIPYLDEHNEAGRIAATLERMRQGMVEREEGVLQRRADRAAAEAAREKAEAEAKATAETLVVETFGEGLKALAEENLAFRLNAELPAAYRILQSNFNHAISTSEKNKREREETARQREAEQAAIRAAEAEKHAAEETYTRTMEQVTVLFSEGLSALADRDLTFRIVAELPGTYRSIQQNFNDALEHLAQSIRDIDSRTASIAAAARQISTGAIDMATRTEKQASRLEQTSAAVEFVASTVSQSAENAKTASIQAKAAFDDAQHGATMSKSMIEAMQRIASSSGQITSIISVIDEIAFQTNLLALNAGVEAARAGDAGRGFAVVASEVRALAGRSAEAAKEIKSLIQSSEKQVEDGVKLVDESGHVLERIANGIGKINTLMADIAEKQKEQATSLNDISNAVTGMDQTTQANAAMADQSSSAARAMAENADHLSRLTACFKTKSATSVTRHAAE